MSPERVVTFIPINNYNGVVEKRMTSFFFLLFLLQASKDLVCFLQLDHVNVYYGQDYRSKYKAPTDYCLALKVCLCCIRNLIHCQYPVLWH